MKRPLLLIGAATAMVAAPLAYGEVVYQNDFSTRTSKGNVPYGDWHGVNYVTGKLVNNAKAAEAIEKVTGIIKDLKRVASEAKHRKGDTPDPEPEPTPAPEPNGDSPVS